MHFSNVDSNVCNKFQVALHHYQPIKCNVFWKWWWIWEKIVFCIWKLALSSNVIGLHVSVVVSMELNRKHYLWNISCIFDLHLKEKLINCSSYNHVKKKVGFVSYSSHNEKLNSSDYKLMYSDLCTIILEIIVLPLSISAAFKCLLYFELWTTQHLFNLILSSDIAFVFTTCLLSLA